MKVPSTTLERIMHLPPNRLYISLFRLAAAGWTSATAQFAIGANCLRPTLAAHTTGAMRLIPETFVQVVFKHSPSTKLRSNRVQLIPVGTKFGRWTVLENDLYKSFGNQTHRACRVRCECRAEAVRTYGELRCGRSPSCGCKSKERNIETVWRQMHNALKRRGWDFHLTLPELKFVTQLPCAYCGKEPSNVFRVKYKVDGVYQRGVDPSMEIRWSGLD